MRNWKGSWKMMGGALMVIMLLVSVAYASLILETQSHRREVPKSKDRATWVIRRVLDAMLVGDNKADTTDAQAALGYRGKRLDIVCTRLDTSATIALQTALKNVDSLFVTDTTITCHDGQEGDILSANLSDNGGSHQFAPWYRFVVTCANGAAGDSIRLTARLLEYTFGE